MKFTAVIKHRADKHTLRVWQARFVTSSEATFVPNHKVKEAFYGSSVLWAQIEIIGKDWAINKDVCQVVHTLDTNNFYTTSYLLMVESNRLIITKSGYAGFGAAYDVNICFVGDEKVLNEHLAAANIDPYELNVTQKY